MLGPDGSILHHGNWRTLQITEHTPVLGSNPERIQGPGFWSGPLFPLSAWGKPCSAVIELQARPLGLSLSYKPSTECAENLPRSCGHSAVTGKCDISGAMPTLWNPAREDRVDFPCRLLSHTRRAGGVACGPYGSQTLAPLYKAL